MFSLYLFALIVGGGLLLFSLLGGSDHHAGDVGHGDLDHGHGDAGAGKWLSLRTLIYFLFVFGGVGAILTKSWSPAMMPVILALSIGAGAIVGVGASAAFAYLRRTDSGYRDSDESFIGRSARVTLPIGEGGAGKIMVGRGDRTFELLARPYDRTEATRPPTDWRDVIIVEMTRGVAIVAPVDDPAVKELASINQL